MRSRLQRKARLWKEKHLRKKAYLRKVPQKPKRMNNATYFGKAPSKTESIEQRMPPDAGHLLSQGG